MYKLFKHEIVGDHTLKILISLKTGTHYFYVQLYKIKKHL